VALVLLDDVLSIIVGVEGVHENKRNIDAIGPVKVLDLADRKVEKGHSLTNLNNRLGANATHRGTKTTVQLKDGELGEELRALNLGEIGIANNLGALRRLDAIPVPLMNVY
jgi:hypothetical protein